MTPEDHWLKDRQLVKQWQNGDDRAFQEIYKQNYAKVEASLVKNLGISPELAEEMFEDAMIVLHQRKGTFVVEGLLSTFLYKIAKNKSIDEIRKAPSKMFRNSIDLKDWLLSLENEGEADGSEIGWNRASVETKSFLYDAEEEDKILQKALRLIEGTICGRIFDLQYWSGLILKDVAKNLNMNESYIRRKVKECEKELKKVIEQLRNEDI